MTSQAHIKALEKAKIALMTKPDSVFFCEIAFSLKYQWKEDIPTAATDGVHMFLNPQFFADLTPEQRVGLILHESLHVVYMHMSRRGTRDPMKWNIAGDHVINLVILERGFELPKGALKDKQFKGMSTEQVYDLLPDPKPEDFYVDLIEGALPPEDMDSHVEGIVVRAALRSQQEGDAVGTIPGDIQIFLNKLLKPELPWHRILQKYLTSFNKDDYTFKKPNRRFYPDYYLPSLYNQALTNIAIAVDTSGSVTDAEFQQFISEIAGIFKMMKPKKITLIQFDTEIKSIHEIESFRDLMKVRFEGRGGTDIEEVVDWVNKNNPQLTLIFTDGCFKFNQCDSKKEFIWLIHNHPEFKARFGKTIHYRSKS